MKIRELKCPNCGADLPDKDVNGIVTCEYCRTRFECNNDKEQNTNNSSNQQASNGRIVYHPHPLADKYHALAIAALVLGILPICCVSQFVSMIIAFLVMFSTESTASDKKIAKTSLVVVLIYIVIFIVIAMMPSDNSNNTINNTDNTTNAAVFQTEQN